MEADASVWSLNVAMGVLLVDILLSGDNAIVIALVCRSLSQAHRSKALWLGVLGAFGARLLLTGVATMAMNLPLIKLIGGLLLLKISIDLIVDNAGQDGLPIDAQDSTPGDVFAAARTIILADIVMSLDNVVALSAISQNNFQMLMAGLLLSIPILMFGSLYIARLLDVFPYLVWVGGAILGGVSGALIIDDPVFGGAFSSASTVANLVVPVIAAGFVLQMSRVMGRNAHAMAGLDKPAPLLRILWKRAAPPLAAGQVLRPAQAGAQAAVLQLPVPAEEPLVAPPVAEPTAAADSPGAAAALAQPAATAAVATAPAPALPAGASGPVAARPVRPAGVPPTGSEHRLVMALGLFMVLSGGAIYYMLNAYEPPVPERSMAYACLEPAMAVHFRPATHEIRFATAKGVVMTTVQEGRIVWEDYREASARLTIPPPVRMVLADAGKLVLDGGAFDNSSCLAAGSR